MRIRLAEASEMDRVRVLFREYAAWLQEDICLQSFEQELAALPGTYAPPRGSLLVAADGSQLCGCVALRPLDDETSEMKRLFVRESFRGKGAGAKLVIALIEVARVAGYRQLRLDTLPKMAAAQRMYQQIGFRDIERYNDNASVGVRFMELEL